MRRSKRADALIKTSRHSLKGHDVGDEITSAWKGLAQSKAALRQIENKLEAGPGTGVLLEQVLNPSKKKSHSKESQQEDHHKATTKRRARSQHSPVKSSSRSPLRTSTQDNTVRHSVEFREPVASYREATPPPHPSAPSDLYSLHSVPGSSYSSQPSNSNPSLSHLVYQRDTRDKQTDIDLDSTHSSAMENMEVRYLNEQPALDTLRTNPLHPPALRREAVHLDSSLKAQALQNIDSKTSDFRHQGESTPSSSPGSASQRLENLRRHQPDDKLEKLKERIRKQRQHLEETAEKEKFCSYLEQPIVGSGNSGTCSMPTVKVRKVATAPSAPIYKGFNSTETKIQTPDGKIWKEEEFHNLSREIYKDLSRQFAESTKLQPPKGQRDQSKERKPVRKVQKVGTASDLHAKPVISPSSWREGQKLVKMALGKDPRMTSEESQSTKRKHLKASHHRSGSDPRSKINQQMCSQNTSEKQEGSEFHKNARTSPFAAQELTSLPVSSGMSADIRGMLDDLQLECKTERSDRARSRSRRGSSGRQVRGGSGSRTRAPVSTWATTAAARGSYSASPSNRSRAVNTGEAGMKKRHYDADSVRQYIVQQQEKRKRQQVEERKALREETEKRHQRLQELYKKQREVSKAVATTTVNPAQIRLQETFNKLLLEGAQLEQGASQMRPMYQPSGESDKENIRLEQAQSPSSSDQSLNHPPVSRNDLDYGEASSAHLENWIPMTPPVTSPVCSNEHLLSQLLRLENALSASEKLTQRPITAPRHSPAKTSRIEALKATASSLSSRIESEARMLAGEGFNYGLPTALDVDSILAPRSLHPQYDERTWAEVTVKASNVSENEDLAERILGSRRMYNGTGFPGQDLKVSKEKSRRANGQTQPHASSAQHGNYFHNEMGLTNDVKINTFSDKRKHQCDSIEDKHADVHDCSSTSISEGPLSEGSLTDGEQSPHSENAFRPIGHQGAIQHSARKSHQRLSEFQKDAENYAALSSLLVHQENPKPAWEELSKGSPLSVINIFTKSLHGNTKVTDMNVERSSPSAHLLPSSSYVADLVYENDFVSPQSSRASGQKDFNSSSNHYEELLRRSSEKHIGGSNTQRSSCSTPGSSPHSKNSTKRSKISDQSDVTLVEEQRSSPCSDALSSESRKRDLKRSPEHSQATLGDVSGLSQQSSQIDERMSPPSRLGQSPNGCLDHSSSLESNSLRRSSPEIKDSGELQYSPAVLQQRVAAELHYLESIEESVRQLGDIERLMGVSVAQHESASLAQMLKAKQQQHEQELYELKIKTEREALETKLQMEENRQRVAQAHIELQEGLAATQKETLEGLQEATAKMMSQQAEAARYTADTARHIQEMTEMAHAQLKTFKHDSAHSELRKENSHAKNTDKANESYDSSRTRTEEHQSAMNSFSHSDHSDSASFRRPGLSEPETKYHLSLSSEHKERKNQEGTRKHEPPNEKTDIAEDSISIEEDLPAALNESLYSSSIPSAVEDKGDTTSVATEYSHKFDESITEDEIEERSFRSLLPSEAHRRESLEKKFRHHDESEEDGASHTSTPAPAAHNMLKPQDVSSTFSGGQDSFSHFTMEMVRQYMRDEEVRLQHQSALLRLRQKALKEKTRAELAWLEHQKKKLRDKGEDDKMPPIKKKQRGLLLKLQQEQAEIKRLQEANKAARKERQLLLKQQEEIERMRSSTLKLKERLRCAATEAPSDSSLSEVVSSNLGNADPDVRSPSPSVSVSGSETSSIMQKLKKMRSQMDEKFLTKREQQLMQRRHHAEELLQWKQRLDQEEAEVRKMEKKALAAWEEQTSQDNGQDLSESEKDFNTSPSLRQKVDVDVSAATPDSSIHTDLEGQDESPVLAKYTSASDIASIQSSPANYTDDFTSVPPSPNRQKSTFKDDVEDVASPSEPNSKAETHHNSVHQMPKERETTGSPATRQTESISDQSDLESRIKALKEELKKRKFTAHQLKKEQKKRTKERLKAQEANLLKQLENYNDFIEKTKAELNKQADSAPDTKSQITDHPSDYRSGSIKTPESLALVENALPNRSRSPSLPSTFSDDDPTTVTPTPRHDSPDCYTSGLRPLSKDTQAEIHRSQHTISGHESEVLEEELKLDESKSSKDQESKSVLRLDKENKMDTTSKSTSHHSPSVSPVQDQHVDSRHQPDTEAAKSAITTDKSVGVDIPAHSNASSNEHMQKETSKQDKASPLLADGYYKTFESSVDASLRETGLNLKPADSDEISPQQDVRAYDSPEEDIEEEISEDISGLSVSSNGSRHITKVLDAQDEGQALEPDGKSTVNSIHSPSVTPVADEMPGFNIGDRVVVSGVQPGTLRFKGPTSFANGFWAGVELDKSEGSNNGTYDGVLYFECADQHGIFAPPDRVTHLTDKFEMFIDTTEDDDSFNDDISEDENEKRKTKQAKPQKQQSFGSEQIFSIKSESGDKITDDPVHLVNALHQSNHHNSPIPNGKSFWNSGDMSPSPLIEDAEKVCAIKQANTEVTNLVEKSEVELNHQLVISSDLMNEDGLKDKLGSFADKLLNNLVKDTVQQFAEMKKSKAKKINDASDMNGNVFDGVEESLSLTVDQKDGLPFFLTQEKEEMSSPELYNRPESPVLGASGQEELAKRLAELELSRELDEFGDDQDWFDEDFGLSSRREQQRLKQRREADEQAGLLGKTVSGSGTVIGGLVPSPGDQQVKTPPRPELPLPMPPKLPEEPAMVVPHSAAEVEKMAQAAALEIWETCGLNRDETMILTQQQKPNPSPKYFGEEPHSEDQEAVCLHSYKKAVFDLTWEILQDIFAEDPNANQPQWVKPQRVKSSFPRVRTTGDISAIQEFVTTEVLKLYGLTKHEDQRTDWPKILKFGRKKRDRVDNILVQELHEEESQWVNYDEDELFVKMQLADSIFDALLKDTADVLTQIYDKRSQKGNFS